MFQELLTNNPGLVYLAIAVLSLAVGSLLNVIIYRLPIMLQQEWEQQCCELMTQPIRSKQSINLFFPRSFCPHCKTQINAWQNIPILSYLLLRGRCKQCQYPISWRYPLIELLTMLLSLYAAWHFHFTLQLPFVLTGIALLICLFFIDLDHQLLPDGLTYSFLWLGLLANTQGLFIPLTESVLSCAMAYLFLWLFIKIFYWVTGKVGMGHGDFKLFAAFGAWLGWTMLPLILLLSSLAGAIIGTICLRVTNKPQNTPIPFGPFLCVAGLIALFWGHEMVSWYLQRY